MGRLAEMTGLSAKQVRRHVRALIEAGHVAVIANPKGGRGISTHYRVSIQNPPADGS
jgi:predicted ArsR family transcriptional regulator